MKTEIKTIDRYLKGQYSAFKSSRPEFFVEIPESSRKNHNYMSVARIWYVDIWWKFKVYKFHCTNKSLDEDTTPYDTFTHSRTEYLKMIADNSGSYDYRYSGFLGRCLETLLKENSNVYIFHEPDIQSIFVWCTYG